MILTFLIFLPLAGALLITLLPRERVSLIKATGIATALIEFVATLVLLFVFNYHHAGQMQLQVKAVWIPQFGVSFHLGVDGLSLPLVFLTSLLTLLSLIYSIIIRERPKEYFALFLLLMLGMQGVFLALDYFLFYLFWEISLVPMYFLIGIWGGPQKEFAAIKFFLYTLVGSVAMLLAIIAIYFNTGAHTFDILAIQALKPFADAPRLQMLVFLGFALSFLIKLPIFPFHTWLPLAHVEAPTAGSVILAGVLLKMGGYGFIRIALPTFPQAAHSLSFFLAILALISIVYGALVALAQTDMKRMIANSSINHMGYVMLGIAAAAGAASDQTKNAVMALNGATLQMFTHGIITGALFMLVGVIYERTHNRDMTTYGGLGIATPIYAGVLMLFAFGSLGLPGLAGFVSEFMVFVGSFKMFPLLVGLALFGIVITATFFLLMIQRMLLGKPKEELLKLPDMNLIEKISLLPLAIIMVYIGILPARLVSVIDQAISQIVKVLGG